MSENARQNGRVAGASKVSVIIPAYDEGETIPELLDEVVRVMADLELDYELIVVDDGSSDDTLGVVGNLAKRNPKVRVVRNDPNMGKGYAIKKGFQHSTGEVVVYLDADFSMHPQHLAGYLQRLGEADIVVASKRHPESDIIYPLYRRVLSRGFNMLVRAMFLLPLSDTQCGFKVFRRRVLEDVVPWLLVKRYAFDVELLVNAHKRGYRVAEAPITLRHGEERLCVRDVLRMVVDLLAIFYRLHLTKTYG